MKIVDKVEIKTSKDLFSLLIIVIFVLSLTALNYGQSQQKKSFGKPFIRNYSKLEYDGASQNWAIVKDHRGVMYFGNNGILEYDGANWRTILIQNKLMLVRSLAVDDNGTVFVGSLGELGYLAPDSNGKLSYVSLVPKMDPVNKKFADVWQTHSTPEGIFFRTNKTLFRYRNGKFKTWHSDNTFHVCFNVNNEIFIREREKGLLKMIGEELQLIPGGEQFSEERIYAMLPYAKNKILIASRTQGLFTYHEKNQTIKKFDTEAEDFLINNIIYHGISLPGDRFAFGTIRNGIIIINYSGEIINIINQKSGIANDKVRFLYHDGSSQEMWVALNNGISMIEINSPILNWGLSSGIKGTVSGITHFPLDQPSPPLWIITSQGVFSEKDGVFTNHLKGNGWCFFIFTPEGKKPLLLTGAKDGVYQFDSDKTKANLIKKGEDFFVLYNDRQNPSRVYVGHKYGLDVIRYENGSWIDEGKVEGIDERVRNITQDNEGNIWITTFINGIIQIKDQKIIRYGQESGFPSLIEPKICTIQNKLLFGAAQGLYKFDKKTQKFSPDYSFGNYFQNVTKTIEDSWGNIWIAKSGKVPFSVLFKQDNGTYKMDPVLLKRLDKIPQVDVIYPQDNKTTWIGGIDNIYKYNLNQKVNFSAKFQTIIRRILVARDMEVYLGYQGKSNIKKPSVFNFKDNSIRFEYAAPYFIQPEEMKFKYFLDGNDKSWSSWSKELIKEYTNLSEGIYSFKVKAKNFYGIEGETASYDFEILPPWHRTIFAKIGKILLFLLFLFFGIWLNSKRLVASKKRLEKMVRERTDKIFHQKEEILSQKNEIQLKSQQLLETNKELEKLSIVASETDNAVIIMDPDGAIEWINEGFTRMYGYTLEQLINEKGPNIKSLSRESEISSILEKSANTKKSLSYITYNFTRSKEKIWAQTVLTPIIDSSGTVTKMIVIDSDISAIKKANEIAEGERKEAQKANQAKSAFLAMMSHDIRTPLNGIMGFGQLLNETKLDKDQIDFLDNINKSSKTLLSLINDILDLSLIESGKLSFESIDFDPELMAYDVCDMISPKVNNRKVEIICNIGNNIPAFIKTDPGRFRQVLTNLMGNAVKFTENGEIELSIKVNEILEDRIKLHCRVRDTGTGIAKEKQNSIFKTFSQENKSIKNKYGGTGLGLSICKQIAKRMNGDVWVESESGKGSTFHFTAIVEQSEMKIATPNHQEILEGKKIVIADDNKNNLNILTRILEKNKMEVVAISDGREIVSTIVENFDTWKPDICIIDVLMPYQDGFQTAREIRENPMISKIPLLAFSSSGSSKITEYKNAGFDGFLPKPVRPMRLFEMIKKLTIGKPNTIRPNIKTSYSLEEEKKHSIHILMAEDNPVNRELAEYMLTKAGYHLTITCDGDQVVEKMEKHPEKYDLILMDIQMPKIDGKQATRILREKGFTKIPIIAVTAKTMKGDMKECLAAGMDDFIPKPIKREGILKIIKKWCI